jgi:hypothetical protein
MAHSCNNCSTDKKPLSVPYAVLEDFKETAKANGLKWFIICLVLIILLVGSNIGWMVYESQFEEYTITQEVEQDADNGENNFIGGDYNGEATDQNSNQKAG